MSSSVDYTLLFIYSYTYHHEVDKLLFSGENVTLFLHALTDGFGNEANTLNQTEFHSQVLDSNHTHTHTHRQI